MGCMIWSSKYSVGVEKIDTQHKELFNKINDFLNAMREGNGKAEVMKTLDFLEEYVNKHFRDEEQIQKNSQYPGYSVQHEQHEEFRNKLKALRTQLENEGIDSRLVIKTQKEMCDWWNNHITKLDSQLGKHLAYATK